MEKALNEREQQLSRERADLQIEKNQLQAEKQELQDRTRIYYADRTSLNVLLDENEAVRNALQAQQHAIVSERKDLEERTRIYNADRAALNLLLDENETDRKALEAQQHALVSERKDLEERTRIYNADRAALNLLLDENETERNFLQRRKAEIEAGGRDRGNQVEIADAWFTSEPFLNLLPNNAELLCSILGPEVLTVGEGPVDECEFDSLLRRCGIEPCQVPGDLGVLIVGRSGWTEEGLDRQIDLRAGESLRVYSQEMVFASLAMGGDVYEQADEKLIAFGEGHPALDYLMNSGFDWPNEEVWRGGHGGTIDAENWQQNGLLHCLGYGAGYSGRNTSQRHKILSRAMEQPLPKYAVGEYDQDYIAQWGTPRSKLRLRKIAESIATFARLKKGRADAESYALAIEEWEADLAWLKRKYYKPSFRFRWPSTRVSGTR